MAAIEKLLMNNRHQLKISSAADHSTATLHFPANGTASLFLVNVGIIIWQIGRS